MGLSESPSPVVQGPTSCEIVEKSWKKRLLLKDARRSFISIFMNIAATFFLYLEMNYNVVSGSLDVKSNILWLIEFVVILALILNIISDIYTYISYCVFSRQLEVTQVQKQLLGVRDNDPGFMLSPVKPHSSPSSEHSLVFSSSPSSQTAYSPSSSPWSSLGHVTPTNIGSFTGAHSYASPGASFLSMSGSHHTSFDRSASFTHGNMSGYSSGASMSHSLPYSPGMSMSSLDGSGLRSRLSMSSSFRSPSPSDKMTDLQSLSMYLKEQDEKEYRAHLSSQDMSLNSSSFWSYGRPSIDYSHILRKNQYQLASRSPQSHKSRADDNDNMGEEVWGPLGVTDDDLFCWIERLRKWIGNTILVKLAQEISNVNSKLRKIGSEDTEIGEVGVSVLKQLALTKSIHIPTLNALVPYLECSDNQEYLVKRIKELGSDGCFSEYYWCSGGSDGNYGNTWGEHLPTDAGLVMHMLCCYLDARLPPDLKYPDGKTFTSQHFMKTPDKIDLKKNNLLLYQSSINPPHFQVVIKDTIYNLPKGRNNLFHAILFFLHHVKHIENGMLGRVNLGMSGVNILCVIDN
ncbi:transmembrane protein 209-like [Ruditapes philippinarum]|uniref:transmembrane protein 209-like n=1 Tax=Ruditapes philippinarum TaxID=129788 RepID=UPI00295B0B82|nr:transmembrane protein 209-like [Ruditapes philippinarum]XP_060573862.1 transmembrane protein 209-like [Ruditapes philippinarum]